MRNIKIIIEYDGTDFFGWQIQSDKRTVQGEIKKGIKRIINEDVKIIGASRTDKGVHAFGQVANFFINNPISENDLKKALNAVLPKDIYIKELNEVNESFHARFDAVSRVYWYYIYPRISPIKRKYFWEFTKELDLNIANEVAEIFICKRDFKFFSMKDEGICNVITSKFFRENDYIIFEIESDKFLRKMVRHILGSILSVCLHKNSIKDIEDIFNGKRKNYLLPPPCGLYLKEVRY